MVLDRDGVGCAHCLGRGAESACPQCGALVCADCLSRPRTCKQGAFEMLRLDLGASLVEVDSAGRFGLSPYEQSQLRAVDLDSGLMTYLSARVGYRDPRPWLLSSGGLVVASGPVVRVLSLQPHASVIRLPQQGEKAAVMDLCVGQDERHLAVLRVDSKLQVFDLHEQRLRSSLQLPLTRWGVLSLDTRSGLVVAALDRSLQCSTLDGQLRGGRTTPGPPLWMGLGSGWLARITAGSRLELLQADAVSSPALWGRVAQIQLPLLERTDPALRWHARHAVEAALGDHGRLAVACADGTIAVYRLPHATPKQVATHAAHEAIHATLLRFVGPHQKLLSADSAGRVLSWPRN